MEIRDARSDDWTLIWPIVRDVVTKQDTFVYDPGMTEEEARRIWMLTQPGRTIVAVDQHGIAGTATMYPNRAGPGNHVASGSIMVAERTRGQGVGRVLTEEIIAWARRNDFFAIQFNAVAETNHAAIHLYEDLGFVTLGIAPGAFRHPQHGKVGLRIMWLQLKTE